MPGRIIQAMRRAEVVNPVILLDEIDKLGQDYRGDPAAALLEVLDPEQNRAFNDHYLEVDYDLSQVLVHHHRELAGRRFPEPLRDRMEIIRLAGLSRPREARDRAAVPAPAAAARERPRRRRSVTLEPDVIPAIVRGYTREAGVRELERRIARVARKLARRRAEARGAGSARRRRRADGSRVRTTCASCSASRRTIPTTHRSRTRSASRRGSPTRAWAARCSRSKSASSPGAASVQLTGTLGDVMKESAERRAELRARARRTRSASTATSIAPATCTCTSPPARRRRTDRRPASRSRRR